MAEAETRLDPGSKAIADAAAAEKRDLNAGADVDVPTGEEPVPTGRVDPFAARKALFKKRERLHNESMAESRADHPSAADLEDGVNASSAREDAHDEGVRSSHIPTDTSAAPAPAKPAVDKSQDGRVTVSVYGKTFTVPEGDVKEAGGIEAYQKQRAAAMALADAGRQRKLAELDRAEVARLKADLEQRLGATPAATTAPASGGSPPAQGATGSADVQAEAERLTNLLYSGDRAKTAEAVAQILAGTRGQATLDPNKVAELAAEKLRAAAAEAEAPKVDASIEMAERQKANAYVRTSHPEIQADPGLRTLTRQKYEELEADPNNEGRSPLDLIREAARFVEDKYVHPRTGVMERKRSTIPAVPTGGGRAPDGEEAIPTVSDHIARLRRAAGLVR